MRPGVGKRERINLFFDEEIVEGLKVLARLKNTTFSDLVRIACREYVLAEGQKAMTDHHMINRLNSKGVDQ